MTANMSRPFTNQDLCSADFLNLLRDDVLDEATGHKHTGATDDGYLLTYYGTLANRPAASASNKGFLYFASDESVLYRSNGSSWDTISVARTDNLIKMVWKAANQTINNSTTLQDDTHLKLTVAANDVYQIRMTLKITFNGTSDLKWKFTIPSGASMTWWYQSVDGTPLNGTDATCESVWQGGDSKYHAVDMLYVGGTVAGTVQFQWAQYSPVVVDDTIHIGSNLIAHRISPVM